MSNNLYVGTSVPTKVYVGTDECTAIYLGTEKVWSSAPVPPPPPVGTPLSSLSVGATVKVKENGAYQNYLLVEQDSTNSITVLLRIDGFASTRFDATNYPTTYSGTEIDTFCTTTFKNYFSQAVQALLRNRDCITQTKSGLVTLQRQCFVPSYTEYGFNGSEGTVKWFSTNEQRMKGVNYWTRSWSTTITSYEYYYYINSNGKSVTKNAKSSFSCFPAIALVNSATVNSNNELIES